MPSFSILQCLHLFYLLIEKRDALFPEASHLASKHDGRLGKIQVAGIQKNKQGLTSVQILLQL